jgi:hypothetical protein
MKIFCCHSQTEMRQCAQHHIVNPLGYSFWLKPEKFKTAAMSDQQ